MAHTQPSPKPSPDGPTSREVLFEPPPVRKPAARRLHELQDPSSPIKARKLFRTDSVIEMAPIDIGESVLAVPVDLNGMSFTLDPKEFDEVTTQMYDIKDKAPKDPYNNSFEFDDPGGSSSDQRHCPLLRTSRKKAKKPRNICLADILNTSPTKNTTTKTPSPSKGKCARISQSHDNVFGDETSSGSDDEGQ